jgi:hypothetical protein
MPAQLPPVLVLLVGLAARGWRGRAGRQVAGTGGHPLPAPEQLGADGTAFTRGPDEAFDGVYVATTLADRPLDRITAHGLGSRSRATLVRGKDPAGAGEIWYVERPTARSFVIPTGTVRSISSAPGMVGKWVGGDGLAVITWQLGDTLVDTGFRLDRRADQDRLLALDPSTPDTAHAAPPRKEHP